MTTRRAMSRRWAGLLSMAFVVAVLTGCTTIGKRFPVDPVRRLEIGVTTMSQVQGAFGNPWRTGYEDGHRTWTYAEYKVGLFRRARTRDLVIEFDDAGKVASWTFNSTEPEDTPDAGLTR